MPHLAIFSISTFPIYPYVIDNWLPSVLQLLSTLKTALLEDTLYLVKMLALSFPKVCIVEFVPHHGWQLARPPPKYCCDVNSVYVLVCKNIRVESDSILGIFKNYEY